MFPDGMDLLAKPTSDINQVETEDECNGFYFPITPEHRSDESELFNRSFKSKAKSQVFLVIYDK